MTRTFLLVLAASLLAGPALAQGPITAQPLGPPDQTQAPIGAPPPLPPAPQFPNVWQPRSGATIQALDKVNARHAVLTLKPNEPVTYQSLTIVLKSCVVRPPDQPADAAAYVTVTDSRAGQGGFSGWLLRSSPATSMMQHPIFDLRLNGCTS